MSKIKEWCQSLVDSGLTPQMPANIDAAIYEQYAKYLEEKINTAEQLLDKAILLPIKPYDFHIEYDLVDIKTLPTENRKIVSFPVYVYFDYDDYKKLKEEFDKMQEK